MSCLRSALLVAVLLLSLLSLSAAQTNLITNGNFETGDFTGWATPLGVNDTGIPAANRLRVFTYGVPPYVPYGWAYDGQYSALWESSTLNQSITQQVAVTSAAQYLLSFFVEFNDGDTTSYLRVSAQFNDAANTNVVLLTPNGDSGALQTYCSGSAASQPPFWWSQFKFTVAAPTGATSMNLTFYGYDSEYGFLIDSITMYNASASFPAAPPATPVVPSTNLLLNGNFETGSVAPWRETGGDNPYGLSGQQYSGEGAYDYNAFAPHSGITCPEGNYCFTFGAPVFALPIQQTVAVPSGTTASYTLSFQWYSLGGYNSSNPSDAGSALVVGAAWNTGSTAGTTGSIVFQTYNTTAVTSATNFSTVSVSLGSPPSGTTSVTLQMQGFFYQTYYVVDYVQLTASGVSQANSAPTYTCNQVLSPLSLSGSPPGNNGAAHSFHAGALSTVAVLLLAALLSLAL